MKGVIDEFLMANHVMTKEEIATFARKGIEMTLAVNPQNKLATVWGN